MEKYTYFVSYQVIGRRNGIGNIQIKLYEKMTASNCDEILKSFKEVIRQQLAVNDVAILYFALIPNE